MAFIVNDPVAQYSFKSFVRPLAIGLISITIFMLCYYLLVYSFTADMAMRGQFGDTFGAANSLLSGLGFSALVYSLYLQRIEMSEQSKASIEESKKVERQLDQIEKQNVMFQQNHFESVFISMLKIFQDAVEKMNEVESRGIGICDQIKVTLKKLPKDIDMEKEKEAIETIIHNSHVSPSANIYAEIINYIANAPDYCNKKQAYFIVQSCLIGHSNFICNIFKHIPSSRFNQKSLEFMYLQDIQRNYNYNFSINILIEIQKAHIARMTELTSSCASPPHPY